LRSALRDQILNTHLRDNVQSRRLLADGTYERVRPDGDEPRLNSQRWMIKNRGVWNRDE
jgi:polyphosphate kinase